MRETWCSRLHARQCVSQHEIQRKVYSTSDENIQMNSQRNPFTAQWHTTNCHTTVYFSNTSTANVIFLLVRITGQKANSDPLDHRKKTTQQLTTNVDIKKHQLLLWEWNYCTDPMWSLLQSAQLLQLERPYGVFRKPKVGLFGFWQSQPSHS